MSAAVTTPFVRSVQSAFERTPQRTATQQAAFASFLKLGLPTTKLDAWKYTDLRRFALRSFELTSGSDTSPLPSSVESRLISVPKSERVIFVDGKLSSTALNSSNALSIQKETESTSLNEHMHKPFQALNAALATDAVSITVKDPAQQPTIYLVFAWSDQSQNLMHHSRISVTLQRHTKATLIEHHIGLNSSANLLNAVVNIRVEDSSQLEHVRIQDDAQANFNIATVNAVIARSAAYTRHDHVFGAALSRTDIDIDLMGEDSQTALHGLIFANDTQHLDTRTCINHRVANTRSREDYRGIADQRGRVVFNGKVVVDKDAQRIDASQSSRNLLLSTLAEIDTRPELEIYANDVKCAHGATVGQLDATALFYLQSRGIARDEARALLTHAFATEVIERIPAVAVGEHVLTRLMERMRSGASR